MKHPQGSEDEQTETGGAEKRDRILRAALEVCARRGVAAARMEEIAALAEVSKGTLYRFFASKEELLLATILSSYEHARERLDADLESVRDPRDLLVRLCDGLADVLVQVAAHARIQYQAWGVVAGTPAFEERLLGFLRSFHAQRNAEIQEIVRAGQAARVLRADVSPTVVADAISALLAGFIYRSTFDPRAATRDALRACFDALIRGYLEIPDAGAEGAARQGA